MTLTHRQTPLRTPAVMFTSSCGLCSPSWWWLCCCCCWWDFFTVGKSELHQLTHGCLAVNVTVIRQKMIQPLMINRTKKAQQFMSQQIHLQSKCRIVASLLINCAFWLWTHVWPVTCLWTQMFLHKINLFFFFIPCWTEQRTTLNLLRRKKKA